MGLGSRLGRMFTALPAGDREGPPSGEIGTDGDEWYGDLRPDREEHPDLIGIQRYRIFDQMVVDPKVAALLLGVKLPVIEADWSIKPGDDTQAGEAIAAAARFQFGLPGDDETDPESGMIEGGWAGVVEGSLVFCDQGSSTREIVWADDLYPWVDDAGEIHGIRLIWALEDRPPASIESYERAPIGSRLALGAIKQATVDRPIPGLKLVHHVWQPHVNRYQGRALIRPCYGAWKAKRGLIVSACIGFDRWSMGIPLVRTPRNPSKSDIDRARGMARSLRSGERGYAWLRGPKPTTPEQDGWDLEILSGAGSLADPIPLLNYFDGQIMSAGLAHFMQLGSTETGARAVAETQADPFFLLVQAIARKVREELQAQLLDRWTEYNFGAAAPKPRLAVSGIEQDNVAAIGQALAQMGSAGMNVADIDLQNWFRRLLKAPKLDPAQALPEGTSPPIARTGGNEPAPPPAPPAPGQRA